MIKNKKIALVLAGGGSLGSYEVGAIEALQELGYRFDIVTGTSIGALNAAFVCNGQTEKLRKLWEDITPEKVMKDGINLSLRQMGEQPKKAFAVDIKKWTVQYLRGGHLGADISPFKEYVKNAIDIDACYASPVRYGVVTTTFPFMKLVDVDMQQVARNDFLSFLHASSACFPIFPIEKINGASYVDGFYNDNLPIRLAFSMGADYVVALDMRLFSLNPQNTFYLTLPNVTYIAPYINFGSLMDFSQEVIGKNMKLGYLDVMKHFKKYRGYTYAITDVPKVENYLSYILKEYGADSKYFIEAIQEGIRGKMDEEDYFVRTMELIAIRLGIENYYEAYSFDEFKALIANKIKEISEKIENKAMTLNEKIDFFQKTTALTKSQKVFNEYLLRFVTEFLELDPGYIGTKTNVAMIEEKKAD